MPRLFRHRARALLIVCTVALVAALAGVAVARGRSTPHAAATAIGFNDAAALVKAGRAQTLEVEPERAYLTTDDGAEYVFVKDHDAAVPQMLASFGVTPEQLAAVRYVVAESSNGPGLSQVANLGLGLLVLACVAFLLLRSPNGPRALGRSRARRFSGSAESTVFADVAGVDEAKDELHEIVEFLKHPEKFAALGARIPKGVLLAGPPGTGKTLLSRAVAGEAGVPFFSISGSEFVEMFVGVGASRVRDLFDQAKRAAPCIVFIDEIDAVGRKRGSGVGGGHEEREQTLNQILVEMDGFGGATGVIVIAATNRPDVLDPALLRPGRFDRQVVLPAPDLAGRTAILSLHARGKPLAPDVEINVLARATPGFSGADLGNLVNEGAILAARRNLEHIGMAELQEAIDRVLAGPQRRGRVMSEREKGLTAYHEAGHAVVMRFVPNHDPVHKVTIISRGRMGGYTRSLPPEDRYYMTRSQFEAMIASALGGHVAERLVFGEVSTGAENDIDKATSIARSMVTTYGMSANLGPVALVQRDSGGYLGASSETRQYSERVAEAVDAEVRDLIEAGLARAEQILVAHRAELEALADLLIEQETVEGEDLERVLSGENGSAQVEEAASPRPLRPAGEIARPAFGALPRLAPGLASASLQE